MKFYLKIIKKSIIFIFISLPFFLNAQSGSNSKLLAGKISADFKKPEFIPLEKSTDVLYPSVLLKHRDQSINYVKNFCSEKRNYILGIYNKGLEYFPKVEEVLNKYNLPSEFKVLIALESGFNGNVVSRAGAVGYWQMMDAAAKKYGLIISARSHKFKKIDERRNLLKSTNAAAKYLSDQGTNLDDDILLTVASYNCGLGNVLKAIRKCGKANADFWDIKKYLPAETGNYVMNFIALNVIFMNYDDFSNNSLFMPKFYATFPEKSLAIPPPEVD